MRLSISLSAALFMFAGAANADSSLIGLWSYGSGCDEIEAIGYQGHHLSAFMIAGSVRIFTSETLPIENSEWYLNRTDETTSSPTLLKRDGVSLIRAWPITPEGKEDPDPSLLHASLLSGSLSPETSPNSFNTYVAEKCDSLPMPEAILYGETLSFLEATDRAAAVCTTAPEFCAQKLFSVADITGNQTLSVAEMARAVRSSLTISAAMDDNESNDAATVAASVGIAPLAAAAFLHSFDYDGSGDLSFEELLGERLPSNYVQSTNNEINLEAWINTFSDAAKSASGLGSLLLR